MSPFRPHGEQARWRIIYERLADLTIGDVISYTELGEAVDLDPDDERHGIQMAVRRAAREFEEVHKHALEPIPNHGYRVVDIPEHLILAQRQQKRAGKALQRGYSKVVNVDLSAVEPEVRNAFQVVAQAFSMQMEMNRRLDTRQRKLEETVRGINDKQSRSDQELAELRERIARLEGSPTA